MRSIVVGVDGSVGARGALDRALWLARQQGRTTRVVHAWSDSREYAQRSAEELLEAEILACLGRAGSDAVGPLAGELEQGPPAEVIVKASERAAAVVLGAGSLGRATAALGRVVPQVLNRASCPVLVVPKGVPTTQPFRRVVVGFDASPSARTALSWALELAGGDRTRALVIRATEGSRQPWVLHARANSPAEVWTEVLACEPRAGSMDVEVQVVHGRPEAVLWSTVRPDDLLVVGTRGVGGVPGMLLGSVSAHCVSSPPCTVAVVRADARTIDLDATDRVAAATGQEV